MAYTPCLLHCGTQVITLMSNHYRAQDMAGLFLFLGAAAALKATTNVPIVDDLLTVSRLPSAYNPSPLSELKVTNNVVQLKRAESYSLSAMYLQQLRRQAAGISEGGVSRATVWLRLRL